MKKLDFIYFDAGGGHRAAANDLAVSADGKWLATGSADGTVMVWERSAAGKPGGRERPSAIFIR